MIQDIIVLLFHSRDYAHRAHLRGAAGYAGHKALEEFYTHLTESVDKLTETWQGMAGLLDLGYYNPQVVPNPLNPVEILTQHYHMVKEMRRDEHVRNIGGTMIQNQLDEIEATFTSTLYKLTYLG